MIFGPTLSQRARSHDATATPVCPDVETPRWTAYSGIPSASGRVHCDLVNGELSLTVNVDRLAMLLLLSYLAGLKQL
jgi:hypothetical protein